jgi:hypothetical protein
MKRLIGLIDVLGYKDKCDNISPEKLCEDISNSIRMSKIFVARNTGINDPNNNSKAIANENSLNCKFLSFADSILLIAKDDSLLSTYDLICGMARISALLFTTYKLPNRGAIVRDDFYCIENENIFAGKAVTQLFEIEKSINFCGVVISKEVIDFLNEQNYSDFMYCAKLNNKKLNQVGRGMLGLDSLRKQNESSKLNLELKKTNLFVPLVQKWSDMKIEGNPIKKEQIPSDIPSDDIYFLNWPTFICQNIDYSILDENKKELTKKFVNFLIDDILKNRN